jgi:hypothetical protein
MALSQITLLSPNRTTDHNQTQTKLSHNPILHHQFKIIITHSSLPAPLALPSISKPQSAPLANQPNHLHLCLNAQTTPTKTARSLHSSFHHQFITLQPLFVNNNNHNHEHHGTRITHPKFTIITMALCQSPPPVHITTKPEKQREEPVPITHEELPHRHASQHTSPSISKSP